MSYEAQIRQALDEFFHGVVAPHLDALCADLPSDMSLGSPEFAALALTQDMRDVISFTAGKYGPFIYRYYIYSDDARATYEGIPDTDIPKKASSRVVRVIKVEKVCLIIHEVLPNYDVEAVDPISVDDLARRFAM